MKEQEIFDIFDHQMNKVGTAPRGEAHANGLWHQTFHCWILSCEGGVPLLLFQLRHPDKDTFPNLLDISCAGHLLAGEDVRDGVRELEEELGLRVPFDRLISCGTFAEEEIIRADLIDREFNHVFFYPCDRPLTAYQVQTDEVTGLFRVGLEDWKRFVLGETEQVKADGYVLDDSGNWQPEVRFARADDFVPHSSAYYELVFAKADDWLSAAGINNNTFDLSL